MIQTYERKTGDVMEEESFSYLQVAQTAVFTAIVFVFTSIFTIATPPTRGFFNTGEIGVYLAALVGGPYVGAIAGGLGSSMADVFLGYAHYAPGTLIIKGIEGYLAGVLFQKFKTLKEREIKISTVIISIAVFGFIVGFGYGGINVNLGVGGNENILGWSIGPVIFSIPGYVFVVIAFILALLIFYLGWFRGLEGIMVLSCAVGGLEMVLGYFLYQIFVLDYGFINALSEIPVNITQMLIGLSVAVPIVNGLRRIGVLAYSEELVG